MNSLEKLVVEKYKVVNFLSLEIGGDHVWINADDEQPFTVAIPTLELLEAIEGHPLYQEALYDYQDLCKEVISPIKEVKENNPFCPEIWADAHLKALESISPRTDWTVNRKMTPLERLLSEYASKNKTPIRISGVKDGVLEAFVTFEAFESKLSFTKDILEGVINESKCFYFDSFIEEVKKEMEDLFTPYPMIIKLLSERYYREVSGIINDGDGWISFKMEGEGCSLRIDRLREVIQEGNCETYHKAMVDFVKLVGDNPCYNL